MHHKRGKPKNARAGCLMCKMQKVNGFGHTRSFTGPQKVGGSNLKKEFLARHDLTKGETNEAD